MAKTTIKLDASTKEKLDAYKASNDNITYDDVVCSLLRKVGGTIVDDVEEIRREPVAFCLEANGYDADGDRIKFSERPVTFRELEDSKVGDTFESEEYNLMTFIHEVAEVLVKTAEDLFIRIITFHYKEDRVWEEYEMIHVVLF